MHRLCVLATEHAASDQIVVAGVGYDVWRAALMAADAQMAGLHAVMVHQPLQAARGGTALIAAPVRAVRFGR